MRLSITSMLHRALNIPFVFYLQQVLCNNYSAIKKEFIEILDTSNPKRILDVGCSTGLCAMNIIDMKKDSYVGVDIESQYVELAKRKCPNGEFHAMDATKLTFPDDSFDLAMFIAVLHHMDEELAKRCIKELRRVVKPTGCLIVVEPVYTPGRWLSTMLNRMDRGSYIRDATELRDLFEGFTVERQRYFEYSLHRCCSIVLRPSKGSGTPELG